MSRTDWQQRQWDDHHKIIIEKVKEIKTFTSLSKLARELGFHRNTVGRHIADEIEKRNISKINGVYYWGNEKQLRKELIEANKDINNIEKLLDDPKVLKVVFNHYMEKIEMNLTIKEIGKRIIKIPQPDP